MRQNLTLPALRRAFYLDFNEGKPNPSIEGLKWVRRYFFNVFCCQEVKEETGRHVSGRPTGQDTLGGFRRRMGYSYSSSSGELDWR